MVPFSIIFVGEFCVTIYTLCPVHLIMCDNCGPNFTYIKEHTLETLI